MVMVDGGVLLRLLVRRKRFERRHHFWKRVVKVIIGKTSHRVRWHLRLRKANVVAADQVGSGQSTAQVGI